MGVLHLVRRLASPRAKALFAGCTLILSLILLGNTLLTWRDLRLADTASDPAQVADALASAAARQPWNAGLAARAGLAALEAGRPSLAQGYLLDALARGQTSPDVYAALGDTYADLGDLPGALAHWRPAASLGYADPELYWRMAEGYESLGQHTLAVDALHRLVDVNPNHAAAHYRLGLILAATDPLLAPAHLQAAAALEASLRSKAEPLVAAIAQASLSGDDAYIAGSASVGLVRLEEWQLARAGFERALRLNPTYADAYAYLGLVRDQLGDDGFGDLRKAVALAPDSALAHAFLGMHYRRAGQAPLAIPELEQAYAIDPYNAAVCAELGGAYAATGNVTAAEIWFNEAVRLAPDHPGLWLLLAQFYGDNEVHVRVAGLPAAQRAVQLAPESAAAHDALGWVHYLLGDLEQAGRALNRALALDPNLASAHYHLGVLWSALGEDGRARDEFVRAVELEPEGRYGLLAERMLEKMGP